MRHSYLSASAYLSHDELDFKARRSELFERDTEGTELESAVSGAFSYTDKNPGLHHLRQQSPSQKVKHFDCCSLNIFVLNVIEEAVAGQSIVLLIPEIQSTVLERGCRSDVKLEELSEALSFSSAGSVKVF